MLETTPFASVAFEGSGVVLLKKHRRSLFGGSLFRIRVVFWFDVGGVVLSTHSLAVRQEDCKQDGEEYGVFQVWLSINEGLDCCQ